MRSLRFRKGIAPSPADDSVKLYADEEGVLSQVDSEGEISPVGGGGGSVPVGASGVYAFVGTFTAADFAAVWDDGNDEGPIAFVELEEGDILIGWRSNISVAFPADPNTSIALVVVDAPEPGSWASSFQGDTGAYVQGDTGPGWVTNYNNNYEFGVTMTEAKTLYVKANLADGPPEFGTITYTVFIIRPS